VGGSVSFQLSNDAPTLTGAKSSFYIDLKFPVNQSVQADGEVVWAENCTVNGTHVRHGDPVYPSDRLQEADGVFPDGKPFPGNSARRRSKFVFVWQTLGKRNAIGRLSGEQPNAVDLTVTCQGSFPSEVCTVVSDTDCETPGQSECREVPPAAQCQLVLRQVFNSSGSYCVNVSLTNQVSLALASTRAAPHTAEALVLVGMLLIVGVMGAVAVIYR
uniref:Uncharacterized protein n=1 Tax=Callorhinchus milii TaxID=7868 RepID=A0A4W3IZU7_CALMI